MPSSGVRAVERIIVKVLIIRLSAIGDVVRTLPALSCLRRAWPDAHIDWAVEEASGEILEDQPDINGIVVFPRRRLSRIPLHPDGIPAAWRDLRAFLDTIRDARYDVVIDFQGTLKTGILSRLTRAPRRIGFGRGHAREMSQVFYTEAVALPRRKMNRVDRALAMIEGIGVDVSNPVSDIPEAPVDASYVASFLETLPRGGGDPAQPVVIFPGTSAGQAYKRYPPGHFARAADRIAEATGAPVVVAWGPGEETLAEEVIDAMETPGVMAPSLSLSQLSALIRRSLVFVSSDTGPMHMAWTVGAPVVAVLGPTDPVLNHPGGPLGTVAYRKIACSPCRNRGCIARTCLESLPPDTVARAAIEVVRRASAAGRTITSGDSGSGPGSAPARHLAIGGGDGEGGGAAPGMTPGGSGA